MSMQNILALTKQKSIQYPNKVWDTAFHFCNTLEDRQLLRQSKKLEKEFRYNKKFKEATGFHIPFLSSDKKSLYRFYLYTEELYQYDLKNWFIPHHDKRIISFEEVVKLDIDQDTATVFNSLLSMYNRDTLTNDKKNVKFLSKFISTHSPESIIKAVRTFINSEIKKGRTNDNNN